ncbi:ABC transporter ATP-binding protein/permease [Anaerocolumna sedimenticola]|uniref:ABC transporter ATP-binding protein/permease n=1 Tax=Anaerocolumna sedimenticola TaxID=2696063 RepID=UPI001FE52376|nr:ATP-binding cassette domain-containing protein [Anaerocolumna sedimenticola]
MQNKAIEVKGLQKSYKKLLVLKVVDFEVKKGSIFALLGSNGAGKTTIVKILTTLLKPDNGTAAVGGFDVVAKPDYVRQSISLTGQFAAVDEILTGRENLIMIAKLRHLINPRQVADDLLKRFGLTDAGSRRVSTYSGGMRRRLDIPMSLVGKPQLIFLDEPTTGLDPEARIEVWKTVKELANNGTTVFLTTQYLDEAFSYPLLFLPFISSAFVPTASMPAPVRAFAENQPVTSIVDATRSLLTGQPVGNDIWIALVWCLGIAIVAYLVAMRAYKRKAA